LLPVTENLQNDFFQILNFLFLFLAKNLLVKKLLI
jgi:hypothetical protein